MLRAQQWRPGRRREGRGRATGRLRVEVPERRGARAETISGGENRDEELDTGEGISTIYYISL